MTNNNIPSEKDDMIELSICTTKGNGCISMSKSHFRLFVKVFSCNNDGEVYITQVADNEYFERVKSISSKFKKSIPQTHSIFQFLESIKRDEKFILIIGNVNKDDSLNNYVEINKKIHSINNIPFCLGESNIADSFLIYSFGEKGKYIGEPDKNKRVCRFCGQSYPIVTFKKKAHAISESLGNKLLFCNEECDKCNGKFGNGIEQDLFSIYKFILTLYGQRGKEGQRNLKGKTVEIDNKNSGGVLVKSNQKFTPNFDDIKFEINEPSLNYVPQNVYKCLSKFAVSLMSRDYLSKLTKTIEWITSNEMHPALPPVWRKASAIRPKPSMGLYVKKEYTNKDIPDFVLRLYIWDTEYLFVFPYIDNQFVEITNEAKKCIENLFKLNDYYEMNLSSGDKQNMPISFEIKLQEGSDIANINKSEFESLSEEERVLKYPNVSAFCITDDSKMKGIIDYDGVKP